MQISRETNRKIVRVSGVYDLIVTAPFATPWTLLMVHNVMVHLHTQLGMAGGLPQLTGMGLLFGNLMGSVVVIWSLVRVLDPTRRLGHFDALARVLFAVWQVHAVMQGLSTLILLFTAFELLFFVLQVLPVKSEPHGRN